MILSIIIPVFNEEKTIIQILKKITKNSTDKVKYEIIVIDDGSTDQTKKLLEDNKNLYNKLLVNDYSPSLKRRYNNELAIDTDQKVFCMKILFPYIDLL